MFAALAYAAKAGEVEVVRGLLRRGAEIDDVDYDKRTALAMVRFLVDLNSPKLTKTNYFCVPRWIQKGANASFYRQVTKEATRW